MFCKTCGKEIPDEARFCPHCGCATSVASEFIDSDQHDKNNVTYENNNNKSMPVRRNRAAASLVLGIVSAILFILSLVAIFLSWEIVYAIFVYASIIIAIIAIVFGVRSRSKIKGTERRYARTGLALGIIVLAAVALVLIVAAVLSVIQLDEETSSDSKQGVEAIVEAENEDTFTIPEATSSNRFPDLEEFSDPAKSDPRLYISYLYDQMINGNVDGQALWDYFLSEESKSRYIESEYVNTIDVKYNTTSILSYLSEGYREMDTEEGEDPIYQVVGTTQTEAVSGTVYDYVVLENGQYKFHEP